VRISNLNSIFGISLLFGLSVLGQSCNNQKNSEEAKEPIAKPNIVFIMADDLGIGDVSCYGATMIKTPNIDKLAQEGMRFENFYTTGSVCTPTRYAVLTGCYPFRSPELATNNWDGDLLISPERMTISSLLKQEGYKTAAIGKWHLGYGAQGRPDFAGELKPGPNELGFDYHWGIPRNHNDDYRGYMENNKLFGLDPNTPYQKANKEGRRVQGLLQEREDDKVNAVLTSKVKDFIRENKEHPFFVYFTPTIAHTHITPDAPFRGTSEAGQYGDFVQELDYYVGEIVVLLEELELSENTLLIFTSDNGGQLKDHWSGGIGLNLADESSEVAEKSKSAKTDAREMGHLTNLDWRDGKGSLYEGGFRVPLIVRWPTQVKAGVSSPKLVSAADFLATFSDLFNQKMPDDNGEDSFSFSDVLIGNDVKQPRTDIALFVKKGISFIDGDWKLVDYSYAATDKKDVQELYNLSKDPSESNNLSEQEPERLKLMIEKLRQINTMGRSR
jgi:arylsulfatase A